MTADQIIELVKLLVPVVLLLGTLTTSAFAWLSSHRNNRKLDIASTAAGAAAGKAEIAATAATAAAVKVDELGAQVILTKEQINGRMTELIATITSEQRLKGIAEGIQQGIAIEAKRMADEKIAIATGHAAGMAEEKSKTP